MNERRAKLERRLREAEEAFDGAERAILSISQQRLAELMLLPEAERLRRIDDAALVDSDRRKLQNSVSVRIGPPERPSRARRNEAGMLGRRIALWTMILIPTLLVLAGLAAAWRNTPR